MLGLAETLEAGKAYIHGKRWTLVPSRLNESRISQLATNSLLLASSDDAIFQLLSF